MTRRLCWFSGQKAVSSSGNQALLAAIKSALEGKSGATSDGVQLNKVDDDNREKQVKNKPDNVKSATDEEHSDVEHEKVQKKI